MNEYISFNYQMAIDRGSSVYFFKNIRNIIPIDWETISRKNTIDKGYSK